MNALPFRIDGLGEGTTSVRYLALVLTTVVAALCASVVFAFGIEVGGLLTAVAALLSVAVWEGAFTLGRTWVGPTRTS